MAVRQGPVKWVLILLVVGLVGIGAAVLVWWPTLGFPSTADSTAPRTKATVVVSAQCNSPDAHDTVEVAVDGQRMQAPLNGCGQAKGTLLDVVVTRGDNGQLTVQSVDAAQVGGNRNGRLTAMLMCLSAMAGALYAFLIRRRPAAPGTEPEQPEPQPVAAVPVLTEPPRIGEPEEAELSSS